MKYFIGCVVLLVAFAGCSSTEPVQQEIETDEPVEEESAIPIWYNAGVHSSSDSLEIHGYALSSAMDSARAAELSTHTALENLRFEIDQTVEEIRIELADSDGMGEEYNKPAFIIRLRNAVSDLSLDIATVTHEHESSEQGVHYSYAKATVLRTELPALFKNDLNDDVFIREIGSVTR